MAQAEASFSVTVPAKFNPARIPPLPLPPLSKRPSSTAASLSSRAGHDVLASAALSLTNDVRDGIRTDPAHPSGSLTARRHGVSLDMGSGGSRPRSRKGSLTARGRFAAPAFEGQSTSSAHCANFAGIGPLTMPLRTHSKKPLSKEEAELRSICQQISMKAAQKFRTLREALRYVDEDRDGKVERGEVHYFFRAYDLSHDLADRFFDLLDTAGKGQIDFQSFVSFMTPMIEEGKIEDSWDDAASDSTREPSRSSSAQDVVGDMAEHGLPLQEEFRHELHQIHLKAPQRFAHAKDVVRYLDADNDGYISKDEIRHFFRAFSLPTEAADRLTQRLGTAASGQVQYQKFMKLIGSGLDMPGMQAVMTSRNMTAAWEVQEHSSGRAGTLSRTWHATSSRSTSVCGTAHSPSKMSKELHELMQDIGRKLPLKFRHVRDAFRPLDVSRDGRITRSEMRAFLRGFDWPEDLADRLFELLDVDRLGEVDYNEFVSHFEPVLGAANCAVERKPRFLPGNAELHREVNELAGLIGERLCTKHKHPRDVFRPLGVKTRGMVTKDEMRVFFRTMNLPREAADKMFQSLLADGASTVRMEDFLALFGPHMQRDRWQSIQKLDEVPLPTIWRLF